MNSDSVEEESEEGSKSGEWRSQRRKPPITSALANTGQVYSDGSFSELNEQPAVRHASLSTATCANRGPLPGYYLHKPVVFT